MNEKTLVICDREVRYAKGLGDNISERKEFAFRVYTCTSTESVRCFLDSHRIDVLLIDEEFSKKERADFQAGMTFVLTKDSCKDLEADEVEIFKYQSADAILAEVVESYLKKSNVTILKNTKKQSKKIIAVYSPVHRIGKTAFAVDLAKECAREKRTLFLCMEGYSVYAEDERTIGDLIYYARQNPEEIGTRLSAMVRTRGDLEYVPSLSMITDLKEITVNEWQNLLAKILEESVYETVILDLDDCVDGLFEILKLCDWIYMPVLEEEISHQKVCRFEISLKRLNLEDILEKTTKVVKEEKA